MEILWKIPLFIYNLLYQILLHYIDLYSIPLIAGDRALKIDIITTFNFSFSLRIIGFMVQSLMTHYRNNNWECQTIIPVNLELQRITKHRGISRIPGRRKIYIWHQHLSSDEAINTDFGDFCPTFWHTLFFCLFCV